MIASIRFNSARNSFAVHGRARHVMTSYEWNGVLHTFDPYSRHMSRIGFYKIYDA